MSNRGVHRCGVHTVKTGLKAQSDRVGDLICEGSVERLRKYDDLCKVGEPECPHHYLCMIGVRNAYQGKGTGRQLVEHLKQIVRDDNISEGICLNTEIEKNIPLYERLGFRPR